MFKHSTLDVSRDVKLQVTVGEDYLEAKLAEDMFRELRGRKDFVDDGERKVVAFGPCMFFQTRCYSFRRGQLL